MSCVRKTRPPTGCTVEGATCPTPARARVRLTKGIADLNDRITRLIDALERGMDPDVVGTRLQKLRNTKENAEIELQALDPVHADPKAPEDPAQLRTAFSTSPPCCATRHGTPSASSSTPSPCRSPTTSRPTASTSPPVSANSSGAAGEPADVSSELPDAPDPGAREVFPHHDCNASGPHLTDSPAHHQRHRQIGTS